MIYKTIFKDSRLLELLKLLIKFCIERVYPSIPEGPLLKKI